MKEVLNEGLTKLDLVFEENVQELLNEKLIMFNQGKRYGQVVFLAGGAGCFDGDTLVKVEEGYKKISEIKEGDMVWTFNEETGEKELKEVDETMVYPSHSEKLLELEFDNGEKVICTENHEFFVDDKWVKAKDL